MPFNFIDVVRYGGGDTKDIFAWRHPGTELKAGTKLTVMPHQIAVFVKNGRIAQTFREGAHVIEGNSAPLLTGVTKMFTGGVNPNDARVYFINLTDKTNVKWGTPSPINIPVVGNVGPRSGGLTLPAGANGEYSIALSYFDPDVYSGPQTEQANAAHIDAFFHQFVSDREVTSVDDVVAVLRQKINEIIGDELGKVLIGSGIQINMIDARKSEIADEMRRRLQEPFARMEQQYGVRVFDFMLNAIVIDKSSRAYLQYAKRAQAFEDQVSEAEARQYTGVMDAQTKLMRERLDAMGRMAHTDAKAYDQNQRGYTFQQEHTLDVLQTAAGNTGSGSDLMNGGIGLGVGLGVGGSLVKGLNSAISSLGVTDFTPAAASGTTAASGAGASGVGSADASRRQPPAHQPLTPDAAASDVQAATAAAAAQAASVSRPVQPAQSARPTQAERHAQPAQPAQPVSDPIEALSTLKKAHDLGLISDDQFAAKQQEILARM
ncbi:SPFH domain-containing protein [Bifidobacterium stellenboschense]|uniref:Antifreeze protein type I n=1 Tax=Bifidobacterium stellenboschense TaxID=762211 RepID=A0A087DNF2_9BIFI|nr:SPFH domain-containing protein [Bifidobacterium stellenboschense]KFI97052.1 antifreeze protein type I [Bifidobacterium stellenboschense]